MLKRAVVSLILLLELFSPAAEARLFNQSKISTTTTTTATKVEYKHNLLTGLKVPEFLQQASNRTLCDHIRPEELPKECACHESGKKWNMVVQCTKTFVSPEFNDTIGLQINIDPCNEDGSRVSLDVTEEEHGIEWSLAGIKAGELMNIPIPGLALVVPVIGHIGIDAAVLVTGNPDSLTMKIGLNACAAVGPHMKCASSIPGLNRILPWYVLHGTYSFGDVCEQKAEQKAITEMKQQADVVVVVAEE